MSLLCLLGAYLLGSIPFGLLLTRTAGMGDIRNIGSGNIGATNVLRTGNKKLAAATLLLDGIKGLLAVWLAQHLTDDEWAGLAAAVLAVLGHMFPVWLQFKGGKGVATTIGALLGLAPWLGFIVILIWLIVFKITRISSLSALISIGAAPVLSMVAGNTLLLFASLALATLVFWRHQDNIQRLRDGTEHQFNGTPPAA